MWSKPRGSGFWVVLTVIAWVAFLLGGWPRVIVAAAFFVFLGSCLPIAILRVLEDRARRVESSGVSVMLIGLCQAGKAATVLGMTWLALVILRGYGMM